MIGNLLAQPTIVDTWVVDSNGYLAETVAGRVGFEPTTALPLYGISSAAH